MQRFAAFSFLFFSYIIEVHFFFSTSENFCGFIPLGREGRSCAFANLKKQIGEPFFLITALCFFIVAS